MDDPHRRKRQRVQGEGCSSPRRAVSWRNAIHPDIRAANRARLVEDQLLDPPTAARIEQGFFDNATTDLEYLMMVSDNCQPGGLFHEQSSEEGTKLPETTPKEPALLGKQKGVVGTDPAPVELPSQMGVSQLPPSGAPVNELPQIGQSPLEFGLELLGDQIVDLNVPEGRIQEAINDFTPLQLLENNPLPPQLQQGPPQNNNLQQFILWQQHQAQQFAQQFVAFQQLQFEQFLMWQQHQVPQQNQVAMHQPHLPLPQENYPQIQPPL